MQKNLISNIRVDQGRLVLVFIIDLSVHEDHWRWGTLVWNSRDLASCPGHPWARSFGLSIHP